MDNTIQVTNTNRYAILGVRVNAMDSAQAAEAVILAAHEMRALGVSCSAAHSVMEGALDPEHRQRLNSLGLVLPDGQPVRWALRWLHGVHLADRVYGPDFMLTLCGRAEADGIAVFLYGSRPQVLDRLAANLLTAYPNLRIAGAMPSAFKTISEAEQLAIAAKICASGAQMVFVGLGCPRQEIWAYENVSLLSVPVIAIGAAFDFHAGMLSQAPRWMQRSGLEWLYRFVQEPRRLWKRYLLLNPLYLIFLVGELTGIARFNSGKDREPVRVRVA